MFKSSVFIFLFPFFQISGHFMVTKAQWVEPKGAGWIQLSLFHLDTNNRFDEQGEKRALFNEGGKSVTSSLYVTGAYGLVDGLDLWAAFPVHRLAFDDIAATRRSVGFGDPRIYVRVGPEIWGGERRIPIAIRGGVKLPVGTFPVDSEIVPLTEGQRDWELILELGHSFYPKPIYLAGWLGYRWRETNTLSERRPGDELLFYIAAGGEASWWGWKIAADGLLGKKWTSLTAVEILLSNSERELVQLMPSLHAGVGTGQLEAGVRIPVHGQNYPAGTTLFLGYFHKF